MVTQPISLPGTEALPDEEVIRRVLSGEPALYEIIMRRYNQRLYRAVRAILRDNDEVEDVMQDAYVRAYHHLADFAGRAQFSTWLTRIAVHEALARPPQPTPAAVRRSFQRGRSRDDRLKFNRSRNVKLPTAS